MHAVLRDIELANLRWRERRRAQAFGLRLPGSDLIADGVRVLPTRVALDPLDDDPTLVCDQDL